MIGPPTGSAERRMPRQRQLTAFYAASIVVIGIAAASALVVLVQSGSGERSSGQVVVGFVIAGAGLVLQGWGLVLAVRTGRRLRAPESSRSLLTHSDQEELLAQVRGRRPVEPDQMPLARLRAERMLNERTMTVSWCGLEISWVGGWIADPAAWRAVTAVGYGLVLLVGWLVQRPDVRRARRFLEEHPQPA